MFLAAMRTFMYQNEMKNKFRKMLFTSDVFEKSIIYYV